MANQFNGFRATKPVVRLIDADKCNYEVFFIVYPDGDLPRKFCRYKKDINSKPKKQRLIQAKALAAILSDALELGWNPLKERTPTFNRQPQQQAITFNDALDLAEKIKLPRLSKFSTYDYKACVRFMKEAAKKTGIYYLNIHEIERRDIRLLVATAKEQRSWSNNARNKYLTILKSLLTVLVDEELIKFNPAHGIRNEAVDETIGYSRLTKDEKKKIYNHLIIKAPAFLEYLMFIYDDGIRRKETLLLKVKDFNLVTREIRIRPEVAKTNRERIVPITDTLMEILMQREIWTLSSEDYLFSNNKFNPGQHHYHPNTPTYWWNELVIKELGIDCKMYSLKHTGADDKINAGLDLDVIKTLYGHRSKQTTIGYAAAIKYKYKEQIIEKTPHFAGKVIELKKKVV